MRSMLVWYFSFFVLTQRKKQRKVKAGTNPPGVQPGQRLPLYIFAPILQTCLYFLNDGYYTL